MSHFKERKQNNCLNCGAVVFGKYCQVCGQQNIEPKESFFHLVSHFVHDITHFDGKFFATTNALLTKPGFLPKQYLRGKRAHYLHPIRMYVFTSAIFFFLFFTLTTSHAGDEATSTNSNPKQSLQQKIEQIDSLQTDIKDSLIKAAFAKQQQQYLHQIAVLDSLATAKRQAAKQKADSAKEKKNATAVVKKNEEDADDDEGFFGFSYNDSLNTLAKYEAFQATLPPNKKDNWLEKILIRKSISLNQKYHYNANGVVQVIKDKFLHSLPQMFFVSLPLFALILQLLYFRRKQFYYTDHGVFSIYQFIAVYILWLIILLLMQLENVTNWQIINYINVAIALYMLLYLYKSMRVFYSQGRAKTMLKFVLLIGLSGIVTLLLTLVFLLLTFLKV